MTLQASRRGTVRGGAAPGDRRRVRNAWLAMLVWSAASLTASFVLAVEAVSLAADRDAVFTCDLNAVVSCGTVGSSWQASAFGFPNAFLGLVSEPVVLTLAVAGLSGVRLPRWMMLGAQLGYTLGLVLAYWLLHQAVFEIGALCPWCLLVTVATTFVFVEMTRVNVLEGHLPLPTPARRFAVEVIRHRLDVLAVAVWLGVILLLLVTRYGSALLG